MTPLITSDVDCQPVSTHFERSSQSCPWVGSTRGLGWVEILPFSMGWVELGWVNMTKVLSDVKCHEIFCPEIFNEILHEIFLKYFKNFTMFFPALHSPV